MSSHTSIQHPLQTNNKHICKKACYPAGSLGKKQMKALVVYLTAPWKGPQWKVILHLLSSFLLSSLFFLSALNFSALSVLLLPSLSYSKRNCKPVPSLLQTGCFSQIGTMKALWRSFICFDTFTG